MITYALPCYQDQILIFSHNTFREFLFSFVGKICFHDFLFGGAVLWTERRFRPSDDAQIFADFVWLHCRNSSVHLFLLSTMPEIFDLSTLSMIFPVCQTSNYFLWTRFIQMLTIFEDLTCCQFDGHFIEGSARSRSLQNIADENVDFWMYPKSLIIYSSVTVVSATVLGFAFKCIRFWFQRCVSNLHCWVHRFRQDRTYTAISLIHTCNHVGWIWFLST